MNNSFYERTFNEKLSYLGASLKELKNAIPDNNQEIDQFIKIVQGYDSNNDSSFLDSFYDIMRNMINNNIQSIESYIKEKKTRMQQEEFNEELYLDKDFDILLENI